MTEEGRDVLDKVDESKYGKFAWVIDPEANRVELWQGSMPFRVEFDFTIYGC